MISIVLTTYNDGHFLPQALESCVAQTVPVEIILVDDGSTKPWPDEVTRFVTRHREIVTQVKHTRNCGLSAARNTGIAHARFDLVIPLDADDWFMPGALAPLVSVLSDEVDIAYGDVVDSGQLYRPVTRPLRRADFLQDTPLFCSSLFRKTVWQTVNGYTVRDGPHYEDWNFWAKAFRAGFRFRYAPLTVYEHRSRPDSMLRQLHVAREFYVQVATAPLRDMPDPDEEPATTAPPAPDTADVPAGASETVVAGEELEAAVPGPEAEAAAAPEEPIVLDPEPEAIVADSEVAAAAGELHTAGVGAPVAPHLAELVDPLAGGGSAMLALQALAGSPCDTLAAEHGMTPDEIRRLARRFVEAGSRALEDGDRKPAALLVAHRRIGQLMIELDRTRAALSELREIRRAPALVAAHAALGRLLLERKTADAPTVQGNGAKRPRRRRLVRTRKSKKAGRAAARTAAGQRSARPASRQDRSWRRKK